MVSARWRVLLDHAVGWRAAAGVLRGWKPGYDERVVNAPPRLARFCPSCLLAGALVVDADRLVNRLVGDIPVFIG